MRLWKWGGHESACPTFLLFCTHCGLPALDPCFREEEGTRKAFCCRACRQVHVLVLELERIEIKTGKLREISHDAAH